MKFTRVKSENFRQHRDVEIAFDDEQGMFVIIKGKMGSGKTNFLNAITWCLYGETDDKRTLPSDIVNQSVLMSVEEGEYVEVSVTLDLDLEKNQSATIKRSQTFKKIAGRDVSPFDKASLTVTTLAGDRGTFEIHPNPDQWIDKFLPRRFRPYFLFDGERLERFFREADSPLIRDAIQEIAKIDVLARMAETLKRVSDDSIRLLGKLSGVDGDKLSSEFDEIQKQLDSKKQKLADLEKTVAKCNELEDELDKNLGSIAQLERNISEKKRLEREVAECERELADYEAQFLNHTREHAPVAWLVPALLELKRHTDEARKNKVLPPPFDLTVLRALLDEKKCICGTDLTPGHVHAENIEQLIGRYEEISETGEILNQHVAQHSAYLAQIPVGFSLLEGLNSRIFATENRLEGLLQSLRDLEKQLIGHNDDQIQDLASRRRQVRNDRDRASNDLQVTRSEVQALDAEISRIRREIEKASAQNEKALQAKRYVEFSTNVSKAASQLFLEMNNEVRSAVAFSLDSQFKEMTWKKESIKQVDIDENYKVTVLNNRDFEILDKLSAGERLCLSFAFSLTLSVVAGLDFPMVVDTPMGRLSPEVQVHLAKVLAEATAPSSDSSGNQIVMLMTETEYNKDVAAALSVRRPKVFEIVFDTKSAETMIVEE